MTLDVNNQLTEKKRIYFWTKFKTHLFFYRDENAGSDRRNRDKFSLENFSQYRKAFVAGQQAATASTTTTTTTTTKTTTSCIAMFPNCSFEGSAAQSLDFFVLQYWQKLSDFVPLTITV